MTAARRDTRPLRHALYTNVAGAGPDRGAAGYRLKRVPEDWPRDGATRLERWLIALAGGGTVATSGATSDTAGGSGMATGAFRLGGVIHAALARIDPSFGRDRVGRGGVLIHALLTPLDEDRPLDDDVFASLLAASRRFSPHGETDSGGATGNGALDGYLEACRSSSSRQASALDADRLLCLESAVWRAIVAAAAAPPATLELAAAEEALPDLLVAATAPLPPRLRLAFRWQVGGAPAPDGTVRVASGPGGAGNGDPSRDRVYRWLDARARSRDVAALEALAGDWTIRSWDALPSRIRALENGEIAGGQR